ncbi:hypothetical protein NHX12_021994 [Muraenolepis orangiensis]|uniref:Uncharacterized protein n=1 Tax=Muraenolepis orangiensis TaxID=630683 RepID=A0A9Q0EMD8_9TELE|nr:hypothetical protein NHX12_021994 [Muraenolepis orangiensis]
MGGVGDGVSERRVGWVMESQRDGCKTQPPGELQRGRSADRRSASPREDRWWGPSPGEVRSCLVPREALAQDHGPTRRRLPGGVRYIFPHEDQCQGNSVADIVGQTPAAPSLSPLTNTVRVTLLEWTL